MKQIYLYLIPLVLALYLIFSFCVLKKMSIEEKIRKTYYWVAVLLYTIIYNNINITSLVKGAPFNLSLQTWGVIIYTISFYVIVMMLDANLIGSGFKEVGLFGASFKKTDKEIAVVQSSFTKLVNDQVFAQSMVIDYLNKEYTKDKIRGIIDNNQFNYVEILKDVFCKYYQFLNIHVLLDVRLFDITTLDVQYQEIKRDYNLNLATMRKIRKYINEGTMYYFQRKTDNIAFLTINTDIVDGQITLIVKSSEDLNIEIDAMLLTNILRILDISTMFASAFD